MVTTSARRKINLRLGTVTLAAISMLPQAPLVSAQQTQSISTQSKEYKIFPNSYKIILPDEFFNHNYLAFSYKGTNYVAVQKEPISHSASDDAKLKNIIFYGLKDDHTVAQLTSTQDESIRVDHEVTSATLLNLKQKYLWMYAPALPQKLSHNK